MQANSHFRFRYHKSYFHVWQWVFLINSIYILCKFWRIEIDQQNLTSQLHYIYQNLKIQKFLNLKSKLILTGYYNRGYSHWGSDTIKTYFWRRKFSRLIEFISDLSLVFFFQRGSQTYYSSLRFLSTIYQISKLEHVAR